MNRVFISIFLLFITFSLSATGRSEPAERPSPSRPTPPGALPIVVGEPVTLEAFIPSIGFIHDIETNASIVALEETTNVVIEWIESSKIDARDKLTALLAGGDYPHLIQGANGVGISNQELFRFGSEGVFLPLNELIIEQGYWIQELLVTEPSVSDAITSPDGNIYGLPAVYTDDYHMTMRQKLWVNERWLENVGLRPPETLDEFYEMLIAFRDYDANGDGDPDNEIPITGAKRHLEDTAMWIMNAFTPAGGQDDSGDALLNQYEFIVGGEILFTANTPEFRDGLRFLNRLYEEGLFDVSALTQDRDQIRPLVDGGHASRVGATASHHPGNFSSLSDASDSRFREYVALPPIEGPAGNRSTPWFIDAVVVPGQLIITRSNPHPEVSLRWADYMFSLDFGLQERGVEGVHWRRLGANERLIGLNGEPAKYQYLRVLTREDNAQINLGPGWTREIKNQFAREDGFSYEQLLYESTLLYEPYKVTRYPWVTASISAAETQEFSDLRRTIHTFVGESIDRFVIGELDVEDDWEQYLMQLDRIGLDRFLEILERGYHLR